MGKTKAFIYLLLFVNFSLLGQEKKKLSDIISVNGYIKYLNTASFTDLDSVITDNLIHNRINLTAYLSDNFTAEINFRNRVFWGESIKSNPFYSEIISLDNGELDLSYLIVDKKSLIVHSIIDRAWVEYAKDKFEIRLGRQRINWGVNLLWNSNDLFNVYNFTNFDYEERAGTDAVRIQYLTGELSNLDIAYKPGETIDESIIAGMFKFNKWKYDFQILGANFLEDIAIGTGWAGNIKDAGFKGEITYFKPKKNTSESLEVISVSSSIDYSFKNGWYLNGSFLFNNGNRATSPLESQSQLFSDNLSAKNLMPTKFSYFFQATRSFNPIISGGMSIIYGNDPNKVLFFMPTISFSIKENWDIDFTGQVYYGEFLEDFENLGNSIFLRMRFSY